MTVSIEHVDTIRKTQFLLVVIAQVHKNGTSPFLSNEFFIFLSEYDHFQIILNNHENISKRVKKFQKSFLWSFI